MHIRTLGVALAAVLALVAFLATGATAAPTPSVTKAASWINAAGTAYAQNSPQNIKCKKGTGSVANTAGVSSANLQLTGTILGGSLWLTAIGVKCIESTITNTTVEGVHMAVDAGRLKFTGVTVMEPAGCVVDEGANLGTVTTEPLTTNLKMDTADNTVAIDEFKPPAGTKFATVKLRGAGCAVEGNYALGGVVFGRAMNKTGVKSSTQPLMFDKVMAETSTLNFAGNPADLFGEVVNERSNGESFGAEEKYQWSGGIRGDPGARAAGEAPSVGPASFS